MKKVALFIPASIRSHVLPSFFLADILSDDYEITYAVTNKILEESVIENGFQTTIISGYTPGIGLEARFIHGKGEKVSFIRLLKAYLNQEIYWKRKNELDELVAKLKPQVIIIDVFSSTDYFVLHQYNHIKLLFFNPMPSTYKVMDYPIVSEGVWLKNSREKIEAQRSWLSNFKNIKGSVLNWVTKNQIVRLEKISQVSNDKKVVENKFIKAFKNIPEILLLPLEFELSPLVRKDYQYYFGLCQREQRKDTELDERFEKELKKIIDKKNDNFKIIYCSFGTFFEKADPRLLDFVNVILEAINGIQKVFLICSINKYILEVIHSQHKSVENALFFSKVPQLQVLKYANIFITHGGMGGIKESIFCKVPMLVYPLDLNYDQSGNALKIEYDGLGLRGVFGFERVGDMKTKITKLLEDDTYLKKLNSFNNQIAENYTEDYYKKTLNQILQ